MSSIPYAPSQVDARTIRPGLAMLAASSLVSTLLLVTVGSIVRVTGYGLGCPDWPLCYGQVVPPLQVGAWVEFTHRLAGAVTSLQLLLLAVLAWRNHRDDPWIFRPAVATVGLLMVQTALGGLHVLFEIPPATGWVHTAVAMAMVGLVAVEVAVTQPALQSLAARTADVVQGRRLPLWAAATASATYLLLLTGAYVTRSGASLACPAFPHCGREVTPAIQRLVDIQMLHRYTAFGVALLAGLTLGQIWRASHDIRGLRLAAAGLATLLIAQFGLGISSVLLRLPMWSRIMHLLVAAMLWSGMVMLWVTLHRKGFHQAKEGPWQTETTLKQGR